MDLLADLQTRHESGVVFSELREDTIRILLPERKATLVSSVHASSGKSIGCTASASLSLEQAVFLAPEQSGVLQRPVGPYSDLYSLGVLLYREVSGTNPIEASNLNELMVGQMTTSVTSLRWCGNPIPRCIDEFILRLLKREPRDRYQSARAALDDLQAIVDLLEHGELDSVVLGCTDRRERLCEPSLVGRNAWLHRFVQVVSNAKSPFQRWLILSQPGEGKTRLMCEFAKEAMARGALVLRMTGFDSENSRPLEAFGSISRDLEEHSKSNPEWIRNLMAGLEQHEESIRPLLPWLFPSQAKVTNVGPEKFAGQRLKRAVESLLDLLNSQPRRIVMLVDNVDSIDKLSRDLLTGWLQSRKVGPVDSLLFVATGSSTNSILLQTDLEQIPEILPPLSSESITVLLNSTIGQFPKEALEMTANASNGNPFVAISLLQGMIESGSVLFREGTWSIRSGAPLTLQSHGQGSTALTTRTVGLPDPVVKILQAGAVLGKSFQFHEAQFLSNVDRTHSHEAI